MSSDQAKNQANDQEPQSAPKGRLAALAGGIWQIVTVVLLVLLIKTVAAEAYYVPSGSMLPSLQIGDQLLVTKFPYGYSRYSLPVPLAPASVHRLLGQLPQYGDVVVFRLPRDPSQTFVKRVVGLPGDTVQMRDGRLHVNGKALALQRAGIGQMESEDGSSTAVPRFIETLPNGREHPIFKFREDGELDNTQEFHLGAGQIFVMGDNRDDSADSRLAPAEGGVGYVPVENLVGRVEVVLGSWDPAVRRDPLWTWPAGLRFSRFFSRVN
jgi:signal peptidase I